MSNAAAALTDGAGSPQEEEPADPPSQVVPLEPPDSTSINHAEPGYFRVPRERAAFYHQLGLEVPPEES